MKKIYLILSVMVILLPFNSRVLAATEIGGLVLSVEGAITIMTINAEETKVDIYEITTASSCPISSFTVGDYLVISISGTTLQAGDIITAQGSVTNMSAPDDLFQSCQITQVSPKSYGFVNAYLIANLGNNNYAFEAMDSKSYLVEYQSSCLADAAGGFSVIFVDQKANDTLTGGDKIFYAINFNLTTNTNEQFNIIPVNNCNVGQVNLVDSAWIEYVRSDWNKQTLTVFDRGTYETIDLHVDQNCKLLNQGEYSDGELTYLVANKQPIYVSFNDLSIDDNLSNFSQIIANSICKINSYEIISNATVVIYERPTAYINIPTLTNYTIGKWGKKIYTDRPEVQTMIGALVKGETDPATYIVDTDGKLRWLKDEAVAKRLFGDSWDSQIIWFNDSIIYTYQFGETIDY